MFCPKCGKKNADNAKFCEFCGAEIKEEEKIILPKTAKKKISKKNLTIIIISVVLLIILVGGGLILSNNFKPSTVALNYFKAITDADSDKVYDYISVPKSEFTTKKIFSEVTLDDEVNVVNYKVVSEDVSADNLSAQVKISYTLEGRQTPLTQTIYLVKDKKNKFLIFPNWKISEGSSLIKENYEISIFKDSTLKLEGIEVGKKYLKKSDDSNYDTYVIPALFKGEYDIEVTLKNGLVARSKLDVDNKSTKIDDFVLNDKNEDELQKTVKEDLDKLYQAGIDGKSFDDIKGDFEYKDSKLDDLEDAYNMFERLLSNSGLRKIEFNEVNVEKISITEDGLLYVTVGADYEYTAKAYLSDDDVVKTDDDTLYLTFDYNDGFKLVDMSSLVTSFSRF